MNEEYYTELNELEAERRRLVNEELEERIELERNLNSITKFLITGIILKIIIIVAVVLLLIVGIIRI
ncbi:MAG: hypothetical protein K6A75_10970 [Ruminococcus sp.]|nr:hypothetical protein [Ruminococcus sp.]